MAFQPGQLVGDYQVLDALGKGGMGHVYRVRNVISDRVEAMKVLLEDVGAAPGVGDRFIAEIRTLARLEHPNIAKLHTTFKAENQLIMVMEFVDGTDLAAKAKEGSIPLYKIVGYIKQVLSALAYAHARGVVHRDIKPSNIMITPAGTVKLMDFGIAKSDTEPLLTKVGTTLGSLLYMSPEQVRGTGVDARSDIYSLGVVLYELTAGRCPFEAESTYHIMDAQLNAAPKPPLELNPSLPPVVNDIILTALQKDPAHRFQNADAFRRALESVPIGNAAETRFVSDSEAAAFAGAAAGTRVQTAAAPPTPAASAFPANPAPVTPVTATPNRAGRRSLWMAAGAVACLGVIAAAVIGIPHIKTSAAAAPASSAASPATITPALPSGSSAVLPAEKPQATDVSVLNSPAKPAVDSGASSLDGLAAVPSEKPKAQPKPNHPVAERREPTPTPVRPARDQAANQQQSQPPAPPPGPSDQELNNASEALMKMQARADAVEQGLGNLKQQQAQAGFGLRGDMVSAESQMNSYLQMAQRALQGRNLDLAQKSMDNAEQQLSKLEKFLGR